MADVKKGDKVKWKAPGGTATGTVKKKLTADTKIKGHTVRASRDEPQYLVETEDGVKAAHKASALNRK